ncbi:MAG: VOC family protein [Nostocaceae cyanobacterium]|nr:VOC family protein [Nostocaceae cyanobacterium]
MSFQPLLSLVVLRSNEVESAVSFYQTLGLSFVEEKHGNGLKHYACTFESIVLEIYPVVNGASTDTTRLGFRVKDLDRIVAKLENIGVVVLKYPKLGTWEYRAVVQDPDGRTIELTEQ